MLSAYVSKHVLSCLKTVHQKQFDLIQQAYTDCILLVSSSLLADLWANPNIMSKGTFWVQVYANGPQLVQLFLRPTDTSSELIQYVTQSAIPICVFFYSYQWNTLVSLILLSVSNPQVSLLDFGATRGFDASFTDVYIEVWFWHTGTWWVLHNCTVVVAVLFGVSDTLAEAVSKAVERNVPRVCWHM